MKQTIITETDVSYSKQIRADGKSVITVSNENKAEKPISMMENDFHDGKLQYESELGLKIRLRQALKGEKGSQFEGQKHDLVSPVYVISVASIQTPTRKWENETQKWLNGEISLKTYLSRTEDGESKYNCVKAAMETDLLERAQSELRRNHLVRAVEFLSGQHHDVNTYLRGVKAWMVVRWFFHVPCIDTNVHTAIKDILVENLDVRPIHHPSMSENAKGQARAKGEGSGKISPVTKKFLQERVGRYGEHDEIRTLWEIVDTAVRMETDIPKEIVAQVAFNVGGQQNNTNWARTTHVPVYEALGANLERFKE